MPNLDDRNFADLLEDAKRRIKQYSPDWDDVSPSDPGAVLLELFAYLTDQMIYRLNRLPEKAYIAFLRLLGVSLYPPAAAAVDLLFTREENADGEIEIPRGTRVTLGEEGGGGEPPVFITAHAAKLEAGKNEIVVRAYHCESIEAELIGVGTGLPGQIYVVGQPPIVDRTGEALDLVIGVEVKSSEIDERVPAVVYKNKTYRIWRVVERFANLGEDRYAFVADRGSGTIIFAPAIRTTEVINGEERLTETSSALAEIPVNGREIRAWYWRGGGLSGNVGANTLKKIKDSIRGLKVINPQAARGGLPAETLENALLRGPRELHSLERAVTARDFEFLALNTRKAARAKAFTSAALWKFAPRGTVEMLLVPNVPEDQWSDGRLSLEMLQSHESDMALEFIRDVLDERRPLGTNLLVKWTKYKKVKVMAKIAVQRQENPARVHARVLQRLHRTINPLGQGVHGREGWNFGQALRVSNIYDIALSEPGVRWVDNVTLELDVVPTTVRSLAVDPFQGETWYGGSGATLFRSLNNGGSWEPLMRFADDERVYRITPDVRTAGLVALSTKFEDGKRSRVFVSRDSGESWNHAVDSGFEVEDIAWMPRDGQSVLLLATDEGLYELADFSGAGTIQPITLNRQTTGKMSFYSVVTYVDPRGTVNVAVATQKSAGVFLSSRGARNETFRRLGTLAMDIRRLAVQIDGTRAYLWAGVSAKGEESGEGCFRWEVRGEEDPAAGWEQFKNNWDAGSCNEFGFIGTDVYAATHHRGVTRIDPTKSNAAWQAPDINSGLPLRDLQKRWFMTIDSLVADASGNVLMAGVGDIQEGVNPGIYATSPVYNEAEKHKFESWKYGFLSSRIFDDKILIPDTWLFVSGEHEITVITDDEKI
jgi:hypothetical protein